MESRVHISVEVSDLPRAIDFYSMLFGREPSKVRDDYANFRLDEPRLHLALVHVPSRKPEAASNRHFGIELFEDERLQGWHERVRAAGMTTRPEENVTCCYATADKFWARDPDGHEWEFWVRQGEADSMHEKPKVEAPAKACCAPGMCG